MKNWIAAAILISVSTALAGGIQVRSIEHTLSIIQRPDGQFDVTCIDGLTEIKSKEDVLANRLCTHLRTLAGRWTLSQGGVENGQPMCNMDISLVRSNTEIIKMNVANVAPCTALSSQTQQCSGLMCSIEIDGRYFSFDFNSTGKLQLAHLDDGFTAVFRGNAGPGSDGGSGSARVTDFNGMQNILQASTDFGQTWFSVCDDGFGPVEAGVACREMGYSGPVRSMNIGVQVSGDHQFGWDDVSCEGDEASLADCSHQPWREDNCEESEHVQLVCEP